MTREGRVPRKRKEKASCRKREKKKKERRRKERMKYNSEGTKNTDGKKKKVNRENG